MKFMARIKPQNRVILLHKFANFCSLSIWKKNRKWIFMNEIVSYMHAYCILLPTREIIIITFPCIHAQYILRINEIIIILNDVWMKHLVNKCHHIAPEHTSTHRSDCTEHDVVFRRRRRRRRRRSHQIQLHSYEWISCGCMSRVEIKIISRLFTWKPIQKFYECTRDSGSWIQ